MESKIYHERITELYVLYNSDSFIMSNILSTLPCAYVITYTNDNVHAEKYVGSTKNLYIRIMRHINNYKKFKRILCIDLYITDNIESSRCLERILIRIIKPSANIFIPYLYVDDREIMKELYYKIMDLDYNIIKIGCRYLKCVTKFRKVKVMRMNYGRNDNHYEIL